MKFDISPDLTYDNIPRKETHISSHPLGHFFAILVLIDWLSHEYTMRMNIGSLPMRQALLAFKIFYPVCWQQDWRSNNWHINTAKHINTSPTISENKVENKLANKHRRSFYLRIILPIFHLCIIKLSLLNSQ